MANRFRRFICILMALLMTAALAACAGDGPAETGSTGADSAESAAAGSSQAQGDPAADKPARVLEVGFGKACITPTAEQQAAGIRMKGGACKGKLEDIYAITLVFRDEEGNLAVHIVTDLSVGGMADDVSKPQGVCDMARGSIKKKLGIDPSVVTVGGTHNHSQVDYSSKNEVNAEWVSDVLLPQIVDSVQQALDDLSPARMYIGRSRTNKLTFVRRYWLKDGTFYDGYRELRDGDVDRHESEADEEIQLVKFTREGKKDVVIVNWQTHATKVSSNGREICADFVGTLRDTVEAQLGVDCVFYQGACGNLAPNSRIAGEGPVSDQGGWDGAQRLGRAVAAYVVDAVESDVFSEVETGLVKMQRLTVNGEVKRFAEKGDQLYNDALKVQEFSKTATDNYETAAYAAQFGIETVYHANSIVQNAELGQYKEYELNIISIGDVAMVTLPMEFFDTTGMQIKEGSPFDMTLLLGYSCAKGKYVADIDAWQHGGYESYCTYFKEGTAEEAVGYYLENLNLLYPIRKGE
ncbi:MAG: hypothetical protein IJS22_01005 [Lachnospiraceae bacterium]|nr:hypothetical protein [Lachnospiraceae bacterium]